jgi:hypothetical protein
MEWLLPALLFAASAVFWVLSRRATDELVHWCRFLLACFLLLLAVIYAVALAAHGLMS